MTNQAPRCVFPWLPLSVALLASVLSEHPVWAEDAQPLDGTIQTTPGPTQSSAATAVAADTEARCFQAALELRGETAWCDVLINDANAELSPTAAAAARLARGYHNRAVLLMNSNELELAEADLQAAMALTPQRPELHLTMANVRLRQGRFSEALELYNDAITWSSPVPPGYFRNRALALRGLGQLQLAAEDVARAEAAQSGLAISPSDTDAAPEAEFR